jgi:hypothetical protein
MESTVTYIVIAIIVILAITIYNYRKKQIRYYQLSLQRYPDLIFGINIQKTQGKISAISISITAVRDIVVDDIKIELVSSKREFNYYSLQPLLDVNQMPVRIKKQDKKEYLVKISDFRSLLMDGEHPFRTFRFVTESNKGKTYKSHEMGFDKKWVIYRPDSGIYN